MVSSYFLRTAILMEKEMMQKIVFWSLFPVGLDADRKELGVLLLEGKKSKI